MLPYSGEAFALWRYPFRIIGGIGIAWVALWFLVIRRGTIPTSAPAGSAVGSASIWKVFGDRRLWELAFVVVAINLTWHYFRVWLPLMLKKHVGYNADL